MITLHRYCSRQEPGDLAREDLVVLWGLLRAENLVEVFFHDGFVRDLTAFMAWAQNPAQWLYAARRDGEWIGMGVVNSFSSSGNTAYVHLVSFACGRDGSCREAGWILFDLLASVGLSTLIAVLPACYRGAQAWAKSFGFVERMRLPGAFVLRRAHRARVTDAIVSIKTLQGA